ncbi:MAG: methyltransferase domain-containing protein [Deltaproteobacteria bacterium]|nr:methyltransferase domain-containing protein [Deltaproteobacteria bacterium]
MFKQKAPVDALTAKYEAQKIAFAPMVFQTAKAMVDLKILDHLALVGDAGAEVKEIAQKTGLSEYAVEVLLESGLSAKIVYLIDNDRFGLTNVGTFLLRDEMTRVNMNFVNDVCYQGMVHLQAALLEGKPLGLKAMGEWKTIYEALASLPPKVKESWFAFDHFYSDIAFHALLPMVFEHHPLTLMDIGANTGKWSLECLAYNPEVHIIAVDLPGQLHVAKQNIDAAGFAERVTFLPANMLEGPSLGHGVDLIWMSQFLCCFSPTEITAIFESAKDALHEDGVICVLDTFWDCQRFEASAFSLHNTSLYFTVMANANSKMYHSRVIRECAESVGLHCVLQKDEIGVAHTLMKFEKKMSE